MPWTPFCAGYASAPAGGRGAEGRARPGTAAGTGPGRRTRAAGLRRPGAGAAAVLGAAVLRLLTPSYADAWAPEPYAESGPPEPYAWP
ncbi:hypothetical protein O1M54_28220 [Streptomyces diastatochromogenes]|nr:hypothetical protein [Streptomyces diastatochromogenes]